MINCSINVNIISMSPAEQDYMTSYNKTLHEIPENVWYELTDRLDGRLTLFIDRTNEDISLEKAHASQLYYTYSFFEKIVMFHMFHNIPDRETSFPNITIVFV